jgi:hypothetical protein
LPSAVRVFFGSFAIVRFRFAADAAFLMFRFAAVFCRDVAMAERKAMFGPLAAVVTINP